MIKAVRAARKCFQYIPHFLMDCLLLIRERARAARKKFNILYVAFSYGLLKKKGARSAENVFQFIPHLLMDCVRKRARAARRKIFKVELMFLNFV